MQEWCNASLVQAMYAWLLHDRATVKPHFPIMFQLLEDILQGLVRLCGCMLAWPCLHDHAWMAADHCA